VDRTPSIIEERTKLPIIMEEQSIMEAIDKNVSLEEGGRRKEEGE
jgi:hypothetical protein